MINYLACILRMKEARICLVVLAGDFINKVTNTQRHLLFIFVVILLLSLLRTVFEMRAGIRLIGDVGI